MLHAHLTVLALAAATLVASGCGKSSETGRLTRAELISKADSICRRANAAFDSASLSTPQGLSRSAPRVATVEQQAYADLASLKPPASMNASWKVIVGNYQTVARDLAELGERAKNNGTLKTYAPIVIEITNAQSARAAAAHTSGLKDCAKF